MTLPHASQLLDRIRSARAAAGHLFVGLDYDGTLTRIVPRPEDAHLPEDARRVLERLSTRADTTLAILSGRALADVRERVRVDGIYFAGNHGLEIEGPGLRRLHPAAAEQQGALREAVEAVTRALAGIEGARVEDKGVTASVHYRQVAEGEQAAVRDVAVRAAEGRSGLRVTEGKCVVELRPAVAWDKGAALRFIRAALPDPDSPALFIGDDVTDEDAFRALPVDGWPVVVAEPLTRATAAKARLRSVDEVMEWLADLAA